LAASLAVDLLDRLEVANLHPELSRVVAHLERQVRAEDRLEAGVVLDQLGVQELAAERPPVDDDRLQVHPGGVEGSRQPGRPAAHDDHVEIVHCIKKYSRGGSLYSCPRLRARTKLQVDRTASAVERPSVGGARQGSPCDSYP